MAENNNLKNNPNYLFDVCKGLEELRRGNKNDLRDSQIEALHGGNDVATNLNKYLFTVASLLIPIMLSLATIDEIKKKFDQRDSAFIELSIIFLFLSLIAGFIHMLIEYKFFQKWLKNTERRLKLWSSISFWPGVPLSNKISEYINEYDSIRLKTQDMSEELEQDSIKTFLIFQALFWLIGIIPIIFVIFRQLP